MSEPTDPAVVERPKFHVGRPVRGVLVLTALLVALLTLPRARGAEGVGYLVGTMVAAVGLPLLFGWIVFRLGGRSLVNPVMIFFAAASVCAPLTRREPDEREVREVRDALRGFEESQRADDPQARGRAAEHALDAMEKAARSGNDDMRVLTQMLRRVQAPMEEFQALVGEFGAAGGVQVSTLDTLAAIDARRELLGRVRAQAGRVRELQKTFVADGEAELRRGGVDPQVIEGFLNQARGQAARLAAMLELRESDVRYFAACDEILTLLHDNFGAWRVNPKDGALIIDADEALAAYHRAKKALDDEIVAQERLEPQLAPRR